MITRAYTDIALVLLYRMVRNIGMELNFGGWQK